MAKTQIHDERFLEEVQEGLAEVLKPYQQRLNKRQRMADFVQQCIRCAERNDFIQLDELLKSQLAEEVEKETGLKAGQEIFDQLRAYAEEQVKRYRVEFIEDLQTRAAEAGLPLEIDVPRLSSLKGIDGEIDFHERKTTINGKALKSIDPRRIISALVKVKRQLYDGPYDPQTFIDELFATYREILEKAGKKMGDPVPIQTFYFEHVLGKQSKAFKQDMDKGKFRGYSANQFAVDLWRYFEAGIGGTSGGHLLQMGPGRNNSLWLIDSDGQRRQITTISFQKG